MGAISEGKAAFDLVKELAAYLKKAGEHDPKLMGMFEELREKVLSLFESDIVLRQQVLELEERLTMREKVFFDRDMGAYFRGTPEDRKDGPFCAKCFHEKKDLVPMAKAQSFSGGGVNYAFGEDHEYPVTCYNLWECPLCGSSVDRK